MRIRALLALACMTTPPLMAAPAAPQTHVLPMWMQGGHPAVAVQLGDSVEPLHFVIDSAAGATIVDEATARRRGLEDAASVETRVEGATDRSTVLRRTRNASWHLGTFAFDAAMLQTDLSRLAGRTGRRIDGILGNDVTSRFDTTYDIAAQQVLLQPAGSLVHDDACLRNALPVRDASMQRFGFVQMQVPGTDVEVIAVVDTGAAQTVLNAAAAAALGFRTDGSDARVTVRAKGTQGLGERVVETWLAPLPGLRMGSWEHPTQEVRISELPVFASLGLKERPALILGADAMTDTRVQIGSGAEWICLRRSEKPQLQDTPAAAR